MREPFSKHSCPKCGEQSSCRRSVAYWLVYVPVLAAIPFVVFFVGLFIYFVAFHPRSEKDIAWLFDTGWILAPWVAAALLIPPIDRAMDDHVFKLRPLKGSKSAV